MRLFSRASESSGPTPQPVPQAILDAVDVMSNHVAGTGDAPRELASPSHSASPFLQTVTGETLNVTSGGVTGSQRSVSDASGQRVPTWWGRYISADNKRAIMMIGGAFVVALIAGGITWYFLRSPSEEAAISVGFVDETPVTPVAPETPVDKAPYAADTPNYLTIDTETVTPESLGTLLSQAGTKMLAANMIGPVEFLPTDKNNNPIAFSRFAYLMNIELSEELLASLGESFSLYIYNDNKKARIGLVLLLKDPAKAGKLITSQESALPLLFRTVLYQGVSLARGLEFRSGAYKTMQVRFVNVDATQGLSFDYVLRGNEWFIGTSKDTLRMILDQRP